MNWVTMLFPVYLCVGQSSGQFSQPLEVFYEYLPYLPQFTYAQAGRPGGDEGNTSNSTTGDKEEDQNRTWSGANNTCSSTGYWWLGGAAGGEDVCYAENSDEPYFWQR